MFAFVFWNLWVRREKQLWNILKSIFQCFMCLRVYRIYNQIVQKKWNCCEYACKLRCNNFFIKVSVCKIIYGKRMTKKKTDLKKIQQCIQKFSVFFFKCHRIHKFQYMYMCIYWDKIGRTSWRILYCTSTYHDTHSNTIDVKGKAKVKIKVCQNCDTQKCVCKAHFIFDPCIKL